MTLEICVDNIEAALLAQAAGADRIELCANLYEGGVTPSYTYINYAVQNLSIPVFPIIRPRGGDFLYSNAELEIMKTDIIKCSELGCKGIVLGLLQKDGTIDIAKTKDLVKLATGMEVSFHRAFDRTHNALDNLQRVIDTGCTRLLTSGLYSNVEHGIHVLQQLVEAAKNTIIIMPGSGVRTKNLEKLITVTGAKEFHSSATTYSKSAMEYFNPNFTKEENNYRMVDVEEVRKMKYILTQLAN
jgi:copper homeostasis protein